MGADLVTRTIYQGCRALPFALAGLSCFYCQSINQSNFCRELSNEQLLQGPQRENCLQQAQLKGDTPTGIEHTKYVHFSRCLNVSRDGEEVMSEGKSFHNPHRPTP